MSFCNSLISSFGDKTLPKRGLLSKEKISTPYFMIGGKKENGRGAPAENAPVHHKCRYFPLFGTLHKM